MMEKYKISAKTPEEVDARRMEGIMRMAGDASRDRPLNEDMVVTEKTPEEVDARRMEGIMRMAGDASRNRLDKVEVVYDAEVTSVEEALNLVDSSRGSKKQMTGKVIRVIEKNYSQDKNKISYEVSSVEEVSRAVEKVISDAQKIGRQNPVVHLITLES